ncbi:MAG: helix-turn-helix transcriptional regulator [Proteobacteria bacterium]|nr:helix-turn-helix transcriptional regulator [Pseudomonadota bacterium]
MLTHSQVWEAIDALAERYGLSASGLAKAAGLDPTTFNKSKRVGPDGRLRWPSTESISKILQATKSEVDDLNLGGRKGPKRGSARHMPLLGFAQAGREGFFDGSGFPTGSGWDEIPFPDIADEHAYALEISGDALLPLYRDGDRIVVSPAAAPRRGDRVVVKTVKGEVLVKQVSRLTAQRVELKSLASAQEERGFALTELAFLHRIVWASQ